MDQLFECNDIKIERRMPLFLTLIGGEAYAVLKDLLAPATLNTKSY